MPLVHDFEEFNDRAGAAPAGPRAMPAPNPQPDEEPEGPDPEPSTQAELAPTVAGLTVIGLREECRYLGLRTNGLRAELETRVVNERIRRDPTFAEELVGEQ